MRTVIIGAGIGGLAAAVALRRVGIEALVIERVPAIREVGAGLTLWSNAVNALRELALEAEVMASASLVERTITRAPSGRLIAQTAFSALTREVVAPCICVHRAVLQKILLDALSPASVLTGTRCASFDDSTAILETGERIAADVLIGAEGISSVIRETLHGSASPRYAGYTCWRGICHDTGVLPDRAALFVIGAGSQFGLWPCGSGLFYWFLTRNAPPGTSQTNAHALALCRDWAAPVPQIIAATPDDAILHNDIVDRPPLRSWGRGRVTLLGDAAHPSTPNLGQGACQAVEDAVVLAHCLSTTSPADAALRQYERLRLPRTTTVVCDSWNAGKLFQLDSLEFFRNWLMGTPLGAHRAARLLRHLLTHELPRLSSPH